MHDIMSSQCTCRPPTAQLAAQYPCTSVSALGMGASAAGIQGMECSCIRWVYRICDPRNTLVPVISSCNPRGWIPRYAIRLFLEPRTRSALCNLSLHHPWAKHAQPWFHLGQDSTYTISTTRRFPCPSSPQGWARARVCVREQTYNALCTPFIVLPSPSSSSATQIITPIGGRHTHVTLTLVQY